MKILKFKYGDMQILSVTHGGVAGDRHKPHKSLLTVIIITQTHKPHKRTHTYNNNNTLTS